MSEEQTIDKTQWNMKIKNIEKPDFEWVKVERPANDFRETLFKRYADGSWYIDNSFLGTNDQTFELEQLYKAHLQSLSTKPISPKEFHIAPS